MSFFSEVERGIERAFRKWTERVLGPAESDELLLVHRAILEEIEGKIQIVQRGKRLFPYNYLRVRLVSPEADRRAVFQMAFAQERRLERDIRECLEGVRCEIPGSFAVDVQTAAEGAKGFEIEYAIQEAPAAPPEPEPAAASQPRTAFSPARLVIIRGKTVQESYSLEKARINIGRMQELTDS